MELSVIDKKLAMDSRDIAKLTSKRHDHVIRDIRNMYEKLGVPKIGFTYKDCQNKDRPYYLLDYSDTITLLTGYSVELRKAVVDRWIYLEKHHKQERQKSIDVRNSFTETLADHGYKKQYEYIQTTKQMKKSLDINHKKDEMTANELDKVAASEALARVFLTDENGYHEVNPVCIEASKVIADAIIERKKKTA